MYDYLIVGAGLAGMAFARCMTDLGKKCLVIQNGKRFNRLQTIIYPPRAVIAWMPESMARSRLSVKDSADSFSVNKFFTAFSDADSFGIRNPDTCTKRP